MKGNLLLQKNLSEALDKIAHLEQEKESLQDRLTMALLTSEKHQERIQFLTEDRQKLKGKIDKALDALGGM